MQLDSADEQAAAIRRELDGRVQKINEMEKVSCVGKTELELEVAQPQTDSLLDPVTQEGESSLVLRVGGSCGTHIPSMRLSLSLSEP